MNGLSRRINFDTVENYCYSDC